MLFALGLGLRLRGIGFLLPHRTEPDGYVLVDETLLLGGGDPDYRRPNPGGLYPQLLPRIATLLPVIPRGGEPIASTLDEHRARASALRLNLRRMVAFLSAAIVPLTWWLARRFLPPLWALVAAAWMAVSVLHIWYTQEMRPHGPAGVLMLATVLAALRFRRHPGFGTLVHAGCWAALSVACLQYGVATYPPLVAALLLRDRTTGEKRGELASGAAVCLAVLAASVAFFYPFLFQPVDSGSLKLEGDRFLLSGHVVRLANFNGMGFPALARAAWSYEPVLLVLSAAGALCAVSRLARRAMPISPRAWGAHRRDLAVVLAFAVPYGLVLGTYEFSYQRFLIPLLPFAACLAAFALKTLAERLDVRALASRPARFAALLLLASPWLAEAFAAVRLVEVRAAPDTITRAADWVSANTRRGVDRILVLPAFDFPLLCSEEALAANRPLLHRYAPFPWFAYLEGLSPEERQGPSHELVFMPMRTEADCKRLREDPAAYLAGLDGDYAVIDAGFEGWGRPEFIAIRAELMRSAVLEASFSPDGEGLWGHQALEFQEDAHRPWLPWTWRTTWARCTGPWMEIYRMRDGLR